MTAPFNSLLLLSAKPGLDRSLTIIGREIEKFFAADRDAQAIFAALDELQRVIGVLQKVPMRGLVVFCSQLEILMKELSASSQNDSVMSHDAIRHALFGLTHYLNAVSAGAPNATLRLFREYQELHQARGLDMAFELDLFYPNLQVDLPQSLLNEPQQIDAASRIKNERMLYQQNLLKWLRQDNPAEALRGMMASVRVVLTCVAQDHQRAFWWVAGGLLNCILHDGVPSELSVKKSLSRIDQRMRALLDNKEFDEEEALSEMLYLVARSHTVSETVQNIKRTFELDAYLPQESPLQAKETTGVLENMRVQLALAEEAWDHAVSGDAAACSKFVGLAEQLYLLSETLDRDTLQFLCKQIHATARHADEPQLAQKLATDMAMALLLLRSGIDRYQNLDGGFHEQIRLLNLRLQDAVTLKPEDAAKLANLVSLHCAMQQREVLVPLAFEMQTNLRHIEQALPSFCDDNNRAELPRINSLLAQVQGGLHILSLDVAEQLLTAVQQVTENCQLGATPSPKESQAVKTALTALQNYLHGLSLGYQPEQTLLREVLNEFIATPDEAAQMAAATTESAASAGVSIRSGDEDTELLDVFLEEAQEVMQTLRSSLEESRRQPDSREPLVTIRRAFHTLKGSGRMVGLTELGEVAWAVERAMNKWLAENVPATPALLDMVGDAEVLFQHWVDMLQSGATTAHIDTSHLLTVADCIENGK
ncbi:MAG: Hpt domain-containing protein, partial [Gallionella sp.]|nr:Hpt domain-containing protein [Gallionella sp.]